MSAPIPAPPRAREQQPQAAACASSFEGPTSLSDSWDFDVCTTATHITECDSSGDGGATAVGPLRSALPLFVGEQTRATLSPIFYFVPIERELIRGTLQLTNYRLLFQASENAPADKSFVSFPLFAVGLVDARRNDQPHARLGEQQHQLRFELKDVRLFEFLMDGTDPEPFIRAMNEIRFVRSVADVFAFKHCSPLLPHVEDGWKIYDPVSEWARVGLSNENGWRLCMLNARYRLAPTYPSMFVVPSDASDAMITRVAQYRTLGRIPVAIWRSPRTGAVVARSSQPMPGLTGRVSADDSAYLELIRRAGGGRVLKILDLRPKSSAFANRAKGGGYEDLSVYPGCDLSFMGIANIHAMRESLVRLAQLHRNAAVKDESWFTELDMSRWFTHLRSLIFAAVQVASEIEQGNSVLIHCSDGWDRTAQVASLALLLLDPFYRTMRGFEILIEKEWLGMGHQFTKRCGAVTPMDDHEYCPVFFQWLDCVYQVMLQRQASFQFNEDFLYAIVERLWDCRFGTFLADCEAEREALQLRERTLSLWSYLNAAERFDATGRVLPPDQCTVSLLLPSGVDTHDGFDGVPLAYRNPVFLVGGSVTVLTDISWGLHELEPFSLISRRTGRHAELVRAAQQRDLQLRQEQLKLVRERARLEQELEDERARHREVMQTFFSLKAETREREQLTAKMRAELTELRSKVPQETIGCPLLIEEDKTYGAICLDALKEDYFA